MVPKPEDKQQQSVSGQPPSVVMQPMSSSSVNGGVAGDGPHEAERLRQELAELRSQLDTRGRRQRRTTGLRQVIAALLVVIAALGLTSSVIGVWAGRTTLNTDRWVETVTPLAKDPAVQAAVSTYVANQVFTSLNVQDRIKSALPPRASFLASPISGQVQGFVRNSVNKVLASEQFAQLWPQMNRVAHTQVMAILNNDSTVVRSSGDTVTLNLLPVVNNVLVSLESQAPTLFGKSLNLPTLTNGQIPEGLQTKIESAIGVTLPANFAAIPIYQGNQLSAAQQAVVQMKRDVGLLVLGTVLALLLALVISPRRRRTTLQFGIWLVIAVVSLTSLLRDIRAQLVQQVPAGVYRSGVDATVQIVFVTLRERGTQLLWLGIVIALVAYLVGPGRGPAALRHGATQAARLLGSQARRSSAVTVAEGPRFARNHLDPLRIGGLVAAGVLLLFFTSWTSLFVIAVALGVYEVALTAVAASAHEESKQAVRPSARESSTPQGGQVSNA